MSNHVPAAVEGLPIAPTAVAAAIAAHEAACAAHTASKATLEALHEANALDDEIGEPDEIRAALTTIHGPFAAEEIATYLAAEATCTAAGWAEAEAWDRVLAIVPGSADTVQAWCAYVIEHAAAAEVATGENAAVTLRRALEHACGALADHCGRVC